MHKIILLIVIFILSSCDDQPVGYFAKPIDENVMRSKLVIEKSTKLDIEQIFGDDKKIELDPQGQEKWIYEFQTEDDNPLLNNLLLKILAGKYIKEERIVCIFKHGVLSNYTFSRTSRIVRYGIFRKLKKFIHNFPD